MKAEDWVKVTDRLPENDATSVLVCDGMIEGGCELFLGYFDGEAWYTDDGLRVFPTHYMRIVLPNED